jgi:GNAT superfamily N-acetyltransferase
VSETTIRRAKPGDEALILALLHELAVYEKLANVFFMTEASIARDFLSPNAPAFCDLIFAGQEAVGLATWYWVYASFRSARGLYLEDLYVCQEKRGGGYGKALIAHLAKIARENNAVYVKWTVLDWNKPSIAFYDSLGAEPTDENWISYKLDGAALEKMAGG